MSPFKLHYPVRCGDCAERIQRTLDIQQQCLTDSKRDVGVLMTKELAVLHGSMADQKPINGWAACLAGSDARANVVTEKSTKRARSSDTSKYAQKYKMT